MNINTHTHVFISFDTHTHGAAAHTTAALENLLSLKNKIFSQRISFLLLSHSLTHSIVLFLSCTYTHTHTHTHTTAAFQHLFSSPALASVSLHEEEKAKKTVSPTEKDYEPNIMPFVANLRPGHALVVPAGLY